MSNRLAVCAVAFAAASLAVAGFTVATRPFPTVIVQHVQAAQAAHVAAHVAPPVAVVTAPACRRPPSPGGRMALACWQDEDKTGVDQVMVLYDHNGAPLFWINNAGGTWAGNDAFGITGYSVFGNVAYLSPYQDGKLGPCVRVRACTGVLVLDGQVITAGDIAWIHAHGG